jgi:hypothetical protein
MRAIAADIDGTDTEKTFFRLFRLLATNGVTGHSCSFTTFWSRVTPYISHQDEAVKHAVIALAAAYQIFQLPVQEQLAHKTCPEPLHTESASEFTHEDLEVFTIQQYNKSISKLQRHVGSSSPESIYVTLICCLAFICLETLRGHHEAAITHLTNGLNILRMLPQRDFDFLADLDGEGVANSPRGPAYTVMECDMRHIIDLFGRLEVSACFFASGLRPVVAERGYAHRPFDDATSSNYPSELHDVRQAHRAYSYFLRDMLARQYETSQEPPNSPYRSDPRQQRQQECLRLRAARLDALMQRFLSGASAPPHNTDEHYSIHLDLLHFRAAQVILAGMDDRLAGYHDYGYNSHYDCPSSPSGSSASSAYSRGTTPSLYPTSPFPPDHTSLVTRRPDTRALQSDLLDIASLLNASHRARDMRQTSKQPTFFNDAGTVGPIYLVAETTTDPCIRARALRMLTDTGGPGGQGECSDFFWDGLGLRQQRSALMTDPVSGAPAWPTEMSGMGGAQLVQNGLDHLENLKDDL